MEENKGMKLLFKYRAALMGFAALWIVFFHEWQMLTTPESRFYTLELFVKRIGFCGVDMFLLLSGMGMVYSLEKNSLPRFYFNRMKRILVPFWAMAVIIAATEHWDKIFFAKVVTGVAFYRISIYSFLWFVPAIVTLYLFVPLYYKLFRRATHKFLFTAGVLEVWLLLSLFVSKTMRLDLYGFTNRIPVFIIGVLFGWICKENVLQFTKGTWLFFVSTLVLGLYLAYQANMNGLELIVPISNCCIPNLLIAMSLPLLLAKGLDLLCNAKFTKWLYVLFTKVLGFFGMMSLEFYCVQEWTARRELASLLEDGSKMKANILLFAIITVFGLLLYLLNKVIVFLVDLVDKRLWNRARS